MKAEVAVTADGEKYRPSWATCLTLEHEVRKEAAKLVNKGQSLNKALVLARQDRHMFNTFFLTPTSMEAGAAAARAELGNQRGSSTSSSNWVPASTLLSRVERTDQSDQEDDGSTGTAPRSAKAKRQAAARAKKAAQKEKTKGKGKGKGKPAGTGQDKWTWKKITAATLDMKGCHKWQKGSARTRSANGHTLALFAGPRTVPPTCTWSEETPHC